MCLFDLKGKVACKNNILFYWLFLNLGLSTVRKNFSRFFVAVVSAEIEVKNCMRSSTSVCDGKWARSYVTSQEVPLAFAQYVPSVKYGEKKAIVSGGDSDSGSLSPSCTSKASSGKS